MRECDSVGVWRKASWWQRRSRSCAGVYCRQECFVCVVQYMETATQREDGERRGEKAAEHDNLRYEGEEDVTWTTWFLHAWWIQGGDGSWGRM